MDDLGAVFSDLRDIMFPYAGHLVRTVDGPEELYLDTTHLQGNGKPLWFGGVQIRKRYVSYHLMPVYLNPRLLEGISPELRKRMQGKSCFNFSTADASLLAELAALTRAGFEDYRSQGLVPQDAS
jgi:hypothetical protein